MDTTQQTIGQIVGDFTELAHDLHDQGVINEGKLKELLDLGMARGEAPQDAAPWPERVVTSQRRPEQARRPRD